VKNTSIFSTVLVVLLFTVFLQCHEAVAVNYVGIGLTNPPVHLSVFGLAQTSTAWSPIGNTGGSLLLYDSGSGVNNGGTLVFAASNVGGPKYTASIQGLQISSAAGSAIAQGDLAFSTGISSASSTLTEAMRIKGSGNVGIGTTNPIGSLDIRNAAASASPIIARANSSYDIFSVLPWNGSTYLGFGIYYNAGWQMAANTAGSGALLGLGSGGANWYNTSNSAASWNVAATGLWTANGTLTGASSRTVKENFRIIDKEDILEKIAHLNISRWTYINEHDKGTTHIGPIAEEWKEAFGTGENEKVIPLIDESGIALAGVQGLYLSHKAIAEKVERISSVSTKDQYRLNGLAAENGKLRLQIIEMKNYLCAKDPRAPFCAP
jgi:hypothetical protein